ncbi:hypothetical protein ABT093_21840 [Kitasatospora sp. NPDC002551]|uniref:hypothetical protein n=1 Tax=Kitasatospora sp. NPDC002551 TaxID=3154539 RepID=UPI0033271E52
MIYTREAATSTMEPFDLQAHSTRNIQLPAEGTPPRLAELAVEFTDAAGRRWQRRLTGGLHLGTLQSDGTHQWDAPRFPTFPTDAPGGGGSLAASASSGGSSCFLPVLLALVAVGSLLYVLLR